MTAPRAKLRGGRRWSIAALACTAVVAAALAAACVVGSDATDPSVRRTAGRVAAPAWDPFLDELQERTFRFFWERGDPATGLVPDRWPTRSFASIAAVGFGLAAYPVGVERGWVARDQARDRAAATLRFFATAPQGPDAAGTTGHHGFFYHFLDMASGTRYGDVELSSVDTAWLIAGVRVCRAYFDRDDPVEAEIRALADQLSDGVEWDWMMPRPPLVTMGWSPESGFHDLDWRGYDEAMMVYVLALGSATHPIEERAWDAYTQSSEWGSFYGREQFGFAPLFGHQYSHLFVDFRGIRDRACRDHDLDYFENSRRATLSQRDYAIANPGGFIGYGADVWGLTPCDGPADLVREYAGREVRFFTYAARGASFTEIRDDGTVAPWAVAASLPFAPEIVIPALKEMQAGWGGYLWTDYGFLDAFNPSFASLDVPPQMGRVVPGVAWFAGDVLGIDQGPIVLMIENHRDGLIWRLLRSDPVIVTGLRRAGFSGGWLENAP